MSSDYSYHRYTETTIKSVMLHNRNVHFILLNKDYPTEWFTMINRYLRQLDSKIEDKKLDVNYQELQTYSYVSEATFYRYHIAELEYDKVIYIDSDIIVTDTLHPLYDTDISNYGIGAVEDRCIRYFKGEKEFNAGVLLVNIKKWKEKNVMEKALKIHKNTNVILPDADQTVLNILFKDEWLKLDEIYNMQVCAVFPQINIARDFQKRIIIHWTTRAKPYTRARIFIRTGFKLWRDKYISLRTYLKNTYEVPLANEWFKLHQLSWNEIIGIQTSSHKEYKERK